ncbi:MAG: Rieske 2Fe-2S domain-containing protein [Defluviicoccus sp.]|nr:Rieske 2Fe-2S domain-containing protein [Defluviicoccus sp.]MDE0382422.1 Rieske 2Fe-2S domain-containing protein [Defluviicoccus sp.]
MAKTLAARTETGEIAPDIPAGLELGLRNYWYPVLQSEELPSGRPVLLTALGEDIALWRDAAGRPLAVRDRCPHRGVRLSRGRVLDGDLQCAFHGLRFDGAGRCTLIPWEPETSPLRDEVRVAAYPADELGGYVWAYIGDAARFAPPPLAAEVPEELSDPENFVWFRLPTEIWDANWLLTLDGGDAFHAVTLHADSQSAPSDDGWKGGAIDPSGVPLADRRVKIVDTPHGIRGISVDRDGEPIHHGHLTRDMRGERVALPGIHTNPISAAPGAEPYAARLWQFPLDATRTRVVRFLTWRACGEAERARARKIFEEVALPRVQRVSQEDARIAAGLDLVAARSDEFLFEPDMDLVRIRRRLRDAFLAQRDGVRVPLARDALAFPV